MTRSSPNRPKKEEFSYRKKIRKKWCYFTTKRITHIDYKNVDLLKRFLSRAGLIYPRKVTGTKTRYQKHLAKAIKRARFLGLLSSSSNET